jgi:hypothetical protein
MSVRVSEFQAKRRSNSARDVIWNFNVSIADRITARSEQHRHIAQDVVDHFAPRRPATAQNTPPMPTNGSA